MVKLGQFKNENHRHQPEGSTDQIERNLSSDLIGICGQFRLVDRGFRLIDGEFQPVDKTIRLIERGQKCPKVFVENRISPIDRSGLSTNRKWRLDRSMD